MKLQSILLRIVLLTLLIGTLSAPVNAAPPPPSDGEAIQSADSSLTDQMNALLQEPSILGENLASAGPWTIYKTEIASNGTQALVYLALVDLETGTVLPTEPLLVLAERRGEDGSFSTDGVWQFTTTTNPDWQTKVDDLPESLLSSSEKEELGISSVDAGIQSAQTFGGYLLPWKGGLTKYLSQGPNHATCNTPSDCNHAWDFYDGTMFELRAAKGGTVYSFKDSCPTVYGTYTNPGDNPEKLCTNYIVLKDVSTTPATYQIYLHIAQASIPSKLRTKGTAVQQGDVIGNVDNNGYSTGHHLHFMVTTNISCGAYCWGASVPITFRDVSINWDSTTQGGFPCTKSAFQAGYCREYASGYKSGNAGGIPPTGGLTLPAAGSTTSSSTLQVGGYGSDDRGVAKMQVIASTGSGWTEVGAAQTSNPFTTTINLCDAGISSGAVSLALRVWDIDGNVSEGLLGLRQVLNAASCPAGSVPLSASIPSSSQVTLFSEPNYSGNYIKLDVNVEGYKAPELYPINDDDAASILIGTGVQAVLCGNYSASGLSDCAETLTADDPYLGDQRVGLNNLSGIKVETRVTGAPDIPTELNAVNEVGQSAKSTDSLLFGWVPSARAVAYQLILQKKVGSDYQTVLTTDWLPVPGWSPPSSDLEMTVYRFGVKAKNVSGNESPIEYSSDFTLQKNTLPAGSGLPLPYTENFDNGTANWIADSVVKPSEPPLKWTLESSSSAHYWRFSNGSDYGHSTVRGGSLTSPLITLNPANNYLRFSSMYETEGSGKVYDQRRVQIITTDGKVTDLTLLSDDPINSGSTSNWVTHTVSIPQTFNGKPVRVRFYFNVNEKYYNGGYSGWYIDNVSVNNDAPPVCASGTNNSPASAVSIAVNGLKSGAICPGSMDYYKLTAASGQTLTMDVAAISNGSSLDPVLTLLGSDGTTVLAENDDPVNGIVQDSQIRFTFTQSGTFYLKLKAYDHPQGSGTYTLRLLNENTIPTTALIYPQNRGYLGLPALQAVATDEGDIKYVEFLMHSADWNSGGWETIGVDQNGADGWSLSPDFSRAPLNALPETRCAASGACPAILVRAYDHAGNWGVAAAFDLSVDHTPPVTALTSATAVGTGVRLGFSASDNLSGLDHLILKYQLGSGSWQETNLSLLSQSDRTVWWVAPAAAAYNLKIMGVDAAGNVENEPTSKEQTVNVSAACTPDTNTSPATAETLTTSVSGGFSCLGDEDWYTLTVDPTWGGVVLQLAPVGNSPVGARIEVMNQDGSPTPYSAVSAAMGKPVRLWFPKNISPALIKITAFSADLYGEGVKYSLTAQNGGILYLPLIYRK